MTGISRYIFLSVSLLILLTLIIAMQFTDEVSWNLADFLLIGGLLLGFYLASEWIFRRIKDRKVRILYVLILLFTVLFLWIEMAVGIFGSPIAGS